MKGKSSVVLNIGIGLFLGLLFAIPLSFSEKRSVKSSEPEIKYFAPALPSEFSFAGEEVPMERWDVKERFDRELLFNFYNKANILFLMKLANRYFPTISERLKANGVPDDFKYLCVAESNLPVSRPHP